MPPDEPAEQPVEHPSGAARTGLPDWLWMTLLTVAILAALIVIGRGTFVA
jgi:hypothetical protein